MFHGNAAQLLAMETKHQRHELFSVQFVGKQMVTENRSVLIPFGDQQCIALLY